MTTNYECSVMVTWWNSWWHGGILLGYGDVVMVMWWFFGDGVVRRRPFFRTSRETARVSWRVWDVTIPDTNEVCCVL